MSIYCLLVLRDFTFIENYFFDKIAIFTKLSTKISRKLLQSTYNNNLSWLSKVSAKSSEQKPRNSFNDKTTAPDGLRSFDCSRTCHI